MNMPGLTIDPEIARLFPPLTEAALSKLENSLLQQGCLTPILQWDGCLISSPVRYELCQRHCIPFVTAKKQFTCREEVISMICTHQLKRKTLTTESRRYLLGKLYRAERTIRRMHGPHQPNASAPSQEEDREAMKKLEKQHKSWTAWRLGKEYALTHTTIEKFGRYSRVLDRIYDCSPSLFSSILSGQIYISVSAVVSLLMVSDAELLTVTDSICKTVSKHRNGSLRIQEATIKDFLFPPKPSVQDIAPLEIGIKTMPAYDPDAEINSLSFTIPIWASSLATVREHLDISQCTTQAKSALTSALKNLKKQINKLQKKAEVKPDDAAAGNMQSQCGFPTDPD